VLGFLPKKLPRSAFHLGQLRHLQSVPVQRWLYRRTEEIPLPFHPTSGSCLHQIERFFASITGRMISSGTFHSTDDMEEAICPCLASWNGDPTPFVGKASSDVILDKVRRCKELQKTGD
jgi:hypothetical protein